MLGQHPHQRKQLNFQGILQNGIRAIVLAGIDKHVVAGRLVVTVGRGETGAVIVQFGMWMLRAPRVLMCSVTIARARPATMRPSVRKGEVATGVHTD